MVEVGGIEPAAKRVRSAPGVSQSPKVAKWQGSIAQDAVLLLEMSLRTIRIRAIRAKAKPPELLLQR